MVRRYENVKITCSSTYSLLTNKKYVQKNISVALDDQFSFKRFVLMDACGLTSKLATPEFY